MQSQTPEELLQLTAKVNNALKRFGSRWALFVEVQRKPAPDYPASQWSSPLAYIIDEERKSRFQSADAYFESHYFFTICWLSPEDQTARFEKWFIDKTEDDSAQHWQDHVTHFQTRLDQTADLLSSAFAEFRRLHDADLLTYLHSTCSSHIQNVRVPETPAYLDYILSDDPLTCGPSPKLGETHLRVLSIKGLPPTSEPGLLDELNNQGFAYRWMTRFIPLDKLIAQKQLETTRKQWFAKRKSMMSLIRESFFNETSALVDNDAENKAIEADAALQDLGSDAISFGYTTTTLIVADKDAARADEKQRQLERVLQGRGFTLVRETVNAVEAWMSSLPGQVYANVRQPLIHTLNLAHFCPLSAVWAGPSGNKHLGGPPLMQVATDGSTPFRLVTHFGDVGHTMVVGPTGAGKSVLLSLIMAQFLRYEAAQVFVFDKGASARAMVLGLGGNWHDLGDHEKTSFQPLCDIDREEECSWALDWLQILTSVQNIEITPEKKMRYGARCETLQTLPQLNVR